MAEQKKSSAMLPLIIVGAALFGLGTYQSLKPKAPEVNTGYVAPLENPRTMQAPDAPAMDKDAAQRAAESDETTATTPTIPTPATVAEDSVKIQITNAPWLQGIMTGALGNFREGVLTALKAEQTKGVLNCAPVLTDVATTAFTTIDKVTCTAKDGAQITGEFDEIGEGDLNVEYPNGGQIKVSKNDGDFNVETRNSN